MFVESVITTRSTLFDTLPPLDGSLSLDDGSRETYAQDYGQIVGGMLPRLTPDDLGPASEVRLSFWRRSAFGRPLFRLPADDTIVYMVLRRTETLDRAMIARMLNANRMLFEKNRSLGGTHYPFSALELSLRDWRKHYGPQWASLVDAKRRYDPDLVLASGPDLFRPSDALDQ